MRCCAGSDFLFVCEWNPFTIELLNNILCCVRVEYREFFPLHDRLFFAVIAATTAVDVLLNSRGYNTRLLCEIHDNTMSALLLTFDKYIQNNIHIFNIISSKLHFEIHTHSHSLCSRSPIGPDKIFSTIG